MITGTLMFDVVINGVDNDVQLAELSKAIQGVVNGVAGVASCKEVDQDIKDDSDFESD